MANVVHINKSDGKKMVQMYHKGVPYFKDKVLKPRLPEWLQEVEYLESTGVQWINTNVFISPVLQTNCKIKITDDAAINVLIGGRQSHDSNRYIIGKSIYPDQMCLSFSELTIFRLWSKDEILDISFNTNGGISKINNVIYNTYTSFHNIPQSTKVYLFGADGYADTYWCAKGQVYYVEFIDNTTNEQLSYFIPCYFKTPHTCIDGNTLEEVTMPANKPCMYDMVTGRCFFNQGTGADFIVGADHDTMVEVTDNTGIVEMYSRGGKVRGKDKKLYELYNMLVGDSKAFIDTLIDVHEKKVYAIFAGNYKANSILMTAYRGWTSGVYLVSSFGGRYTYHATPFIQSPISTNEICDITIDKETISFNDSTYEIEDKGIINGTLALFGYKNSDRIGNGKIRLCSIENEIKLYPCKLITDIPADKASDNKPHNAGECGMWDMVSDRFFGNTNTEGEFTVE